MTELTAVNKCFRIGNEVILGEMVEFKLYDMDKDEKMGSIWLSIKELKEVIQLCNKGIKRIEKEQ